MVTENERKEGGKDTNFKEKKLNKNGNFGERVKLMVNDILDN